MIIMTDKRNSKRFHSINYQIRGDIMKGDYGSLSWVNDESGKEYVCTVDREHIDEKRYENLSENERKTCSDVNQIVGTERW